MKVAPMPDGLPHEHLGLSHVCKHYLNPAEVWEDLADGVEPALRPLRLMEALRRPKYVFGNPDRVPDWALSHLSILSQVNGDGYTTAVNDRMRALVEPPGGGWRRQDRGGYGAHVGAGLIVIARRWRERWELKTAFRALRYAFVDSPLPADPYSRRSRAKLAERKVTRRRLGKGGEDV